MAELRGYVLTISRAESSSELEAELLQRYGPTIVTVEVSDLGTGLDGAEVEQIRKAAEAIFRAHVG